MDTWIQEWGLWGLFASAFVSSTLMPGGSEVIVAALRLHAGHPAGLILVVATLGNTLGGMSSWAIGHLLAWRWPADQPAERRRRQAVAWLRDHGSPLLLLSWLPVIGDPLCVAAGWLRIAFWPALLFIAAGKALRYAVILLAVERLA